MKKLFLFLAIAVFASCSARNEASEINQTNSNGLTQEEQNKVNDTKRKMKEIGIELSDDENPEEFDHNLAKSDTSKILDYLRNIRDKFNSAPANVNIRILTKEESQKEWDNMSAEEKEEIYRIIREDTEKTKE